MSDRPHPMLTLSRRAGAAVGRVPPAGYGLLFFLMIPLYALVYWWISPAEFYHQTVAHEEPYYRQIAELKRQLSEVLVADLRLAYEGDVVVLSEAEALCLDRLDTTEFAVDELGNVSFRMLAPVADATMLREGRCAGDASPSVVVLDAAADLGPWFGPAAEAAASEPPTPEWLPVTFTTSDSYAAARRLFPRPANGETLRRGEDAIVYEFAMPASLASRFEAVVSVNQGSAEGVPGEFLRLLYFSAATATTTGYGDIVPLTTRARILTVSEAIVGMLVIGLFLNSLTSRRTRDGGQV